MSIIARTRKFKGLWNRRVFEDPPERCTQLQNFTINENGYPEGRMGWQKIQRASEAYDASSPVRTGSATSMCTGVFSRQSNRFLVMRFNAAGTVYSEDLGNQSYFDLFNVLAANESLVIVSPQQFSLIELYNGQSSGTMTLIYEYSSPAGWQTLASGSFTDPNLTLTGLHTFRFPPPSTEIGYAQNWGGGWHNGYYGFGIRIRISALGGAATMPTSAQQRIRGDSGQQNDLLLSSSDRAAGALSARIDRVGVGPVAGPTLTRWFTVDNAGGPGLPAGNDSPVRMVGHDGVVYAVNGHFQRRIPGNPALNRDVGFPAPVKAGGGAPSFQCTAAGPTVGVGFQGTYLYALTASYGPEGRWGESSPLFCLTAAGALNPVVLAGPSEVEIQVPQAWLGGVASGEIDRINIYRTDNLTNAAPNAIALMPLFYMGSFTRNDANGGLTAAAAWPQIPSTAAGPAYQYLDTSRTFPTETRHLDVVDRTPPSRCRFAVFTKNRLLLGGNDQYPARVWPSRIGEYEAFDVTREYQDFTNQVSSALKGMVEFQDWTVVFTEQSTHLISNLDQEDWNVQTIFPNIGCVAPDSIRVAYGRLFWLAVQGVWMWDGVNPPKNISYPLRIEQCSVLVHGASRATTYRYGYEIELIPTDRRFDFATEWPPTQFASTYTKYFYNVKSDEWNTVSSSMPNASHQQPIGTVIIPAASNYVGREVPIYARHRYAGSATDLNVYMGDSGLKDGGLQDAGGTDVSGIIALLYNAAESELIIPHQWEIAADGVNNATAVWSISTSTTIGHKPALNATGDFDTSSEHDILRSRFSEFGSGCAILGLRITLIFNEAGVAKIYGAWLHGTKKNRVQPG